MNAPYGTIELGWYKDVARPFDEVLPRVKDELAKVGFGVLTEIAVHEKFKEKIGRTDFPRYHILGACNPKLASAALDMNRDVGLLIPCNVTVEDLGHAKTRVGFTRPSKLMLAFGSDSHICALAEGAEEKLKGAFDAI